MAYLAAEVLLLDQGLGARRSSSAPTMAYLAAEVLAGFWSICTVPGLGARKCDMGGLRECSI